MDELTQWERHRLAALERQLSVEDPELADRLARPLQARRPRALARSGWATIWAGAVLLLCGGALGDGSSMLLGLLMLTCGPAIVWRARAAARDPGPAPRP